MELIVVSRELPRTTTPNPTDEATHGPGPWSRCCEPTSSAQSSTTTRTYASDADLHLA